MDEDSPTDEETEHLRELFVDATGTDTATTEQRADRGSLLGGDAEGVVDVVGEMRDRYGFETALADDAMATVVRRFYDGTDDEAIAEELGVDAGVVRRARLDLHLLRDGDADPALLAAVRAGEAPDDADPAALERARAVARTQERARRASERFRAAFEETLTDADLEGRVVGDARADGLREAAEDIDPEVDIDI